MRYIFCSVNIRIKWGKLWRNFQANLYADRQQAALSWCFLMPWVSDGH